MDLRKFLSYFDYHIVVPDNKYEAHIRQSLADRIHAAENKIITSLPDEISKEKNAAQTR